MDTNGPITSLYKYCPVKSDTHLKKEYSVKNLLKHRAAFSSRKNFNDLFDSQVNFIPPTKEELKAVLEGLPQRKKKAFKHDYLTGHLKGRLNKFEKIISNTLDSYLFYCVTTKATSNLMWAHYASNHTGFCIEWDSTHIKAEQMDYEKKIAQIKLIDWIKREAEGKSADEDQKRFIRALCVKLKEWRYESEYRLLLGEDMDSPIKKREENFTLVEYPPQWIKSIIWGCRSTDKTKAYIREHLPQYKYREAYLDLKNSQICIRDEKPVWRAQPLVSKQTPEPSIS
ncbi:MAG: DUF2971 domain-containing protein [Gammaproteobacteria bacterium]|nr:DUF2971 domain-containing protein [Gammaproteobacteria bacterium]